MRLALRNNSGEIVVVGGVAQLSDAICDLFDLLQKPRIHRSHPRNFSHRMPAAKCIANVGQADQDAA